jgi:fatty acid desaturase
MDSISPKDKNLEQPKINAIRKSIYAEDKRIREKHPWLIHQNFIGSLIFTGCVLGMFLTSYLYISGSLAWYFTIPLMGMIISLLHELEHDLIHDLYFKERAWVQHLMFAVIWVSKVNANPWWRKPLHLKHHKTSGQVDDIEERLIGLGLPLGWKRLCITLSAFGAFLVMNEVAEDSRKMKSSPGVSVFRTSLVNLPVLLPAHLALAGVLAQGLIPEMWYEICWNVCMLLFFPNVVRQACLVIVSTGVHYYGDIPEKNVFYQNQVLNHWMFYPLQAFCFNFGATHVIHHYVARQPFYLRQMIAPAVCVELRKQGVRFNDLQIYSRAHRFNIPASEPSATLVGA